MLEITIEINTAIARPSIKRESLGSAKVKYTIVSEEEADLRAGKISASSPFGKGLLGKKVGELAQIQAPAGHMEFEIMSLSR